MTKKQSSSNILSDTQQKVLQFVQNFGYVDNWVLKHRFTKLPKNDILKRLDERGFLSKITPQYVKTSCLESHKGPNNCDRYVLTEKGKYWTRIVKDYKFKIFDGIPYIHRMKVKPKKDTPHVVKRLKNTFNLVRTIKSNEHTNIYVHPNVPSQIKEIFKNWKNLDKLKRNIRMVEHFINGSILIHPEQKRKYLKELKSKYNKLLKTL